MGARRDPRREGPLADDPCEAHVSKATSWRHAPWSVPSSTVPSRSRATDDPESAAASRAYRGARAALRRRGVDARVVDALKRDCSSRLHDARRAYAWDHGQTVEVPRPRRGPLGVGRPRSHTVTTAMSMSGDPRRRARAARRAEERCADRPAGPGLRLDPGARAKGGGCRARAATACATRPCNTRRRTALSASTRTQSFPWRLATRVKTVHRAIRSSLILALVAAMCVALPNAAGPLRPRIGSTLPSGTRSPMASARAMRRGPRTCRSCPVLHAASNRERPHALQPLATRRRRATRSSPAASWRWPSLRSSTSDRHSRCHLDIGGNDLLF